MSTFSKWFTYREKEVKDLLKKYKNHLAKAKLERNYYNKNTKLAEVQKNLINQKYLIMKGIVALILLLIIVMIEPKIFMYHILINR